MKKKIIIPVVICILVIMCVVVFLLLNRKTGTVITLDINPSIEIVLDKDENIISISALNEDAKDIVAIDFNNKTLDDVFGSIVDKLIDNELTSDNSVDVIIYSKGDMKGSKVAEKLEFNFGQKNIHAETIVIDKITKEDIELAAKYNVSPAKASYIKTIVKDNENIKVEDLINKPVREVNNTIKTGKYCDEGYSLDNDACLKEISRVNAKEGNVCPSGTEEYKGACYKTSPISDGEEYCTEGTLKDHKCIIPVTIPATGKCEKGDYDNSYCVIREYYGEAHQYCRLTPSTDLLRNGKCYGRKPPINGGCLGGDSLVGGYCYDFSANSGYKADWVCPDGSFLTNPEGSLPNNDTKCYKETKTQVTSYYCEEGYTLSGTNCTKEEEHGVEHKMVCPSGYTLVNTRCYNLNKSYDKEPGFICEGENTRAQGNVCITYEIIPAKEY